MRRASSLLGPAALMHLAFGLVLLVGLTAAPGAHAKRKAKNKQGALVITCSHEGASVSVDGRKFGTTPVKPLAVSAGTHTVLVELEGFLPFKREITIKSGKPLDLKVDMLPFAGVLEVTANVKGAKVIIDGEPAGAVPLTKEVKLGSRTIEVTAPGYTTWTRKISAAAGKRFKLAAELVKGTGAPVAKVDSKPAPTDDELEDDLALAPLEMPPPSAKPGAPSKPGAAGKPGTAAAAVAEDEPDDLALEMPPLAGGDDDPPMEAIPGAEPSLELEAVPGQAPELTGLPPGTLTRTIEPVTPWYLRWYTLTGGAVVVAAAVIIPTVIVMTSPKCELEEVMFYTPGVGTSTQTICPTQ